MNAPTYQSCATLKSFRSFLETGYRTQSKIRKINFNEYPLWFTFSTQHESWSFHVVDGKNT